MILVDTSVWIDFFRKSPTPESRTLHSLLEQDELLAITGLIFAEILQGVRDGKSLEKVKRALGVLTILDPSSLATYEAAAGIYRSCRARGATIRSLVDCVVEAIAIENKILVLQKVRDCLEIAKNSGLNLYPDLLP